MKIYVVVHHYYDIRNNEKVRIHKIVSKPVGYGEGEKIIEEFKKSENYHKGDRMTLVRWLTIGYVIDNEIQFMDYN